MLRITQFWKNLYMHITMVLCVYTIITSPVKHSTEIYCVLYHTCKHYIFDILLTGTILWLPINWNVFCLENVFVVPQSPPPSLSCRVSYLIFWWWWLQGNVIVTLALKWSRCVLWLTCTDCCKIFHRRCVPHITKQEFELSSCKTRQWLCQNCFNSILPYNHLNDSNEFIAAISETWFNDSLPKSTDLDILSFNPFETETADHGNVIGDADPDINYFKETLNKTIAEWCITLEEDFNTIYENSKLSP